jgi:hypothetical protein
MPPQEAPSATSDSEIVAAWAGTLMALRLIFAWIGVAFLRKLVAATSAVFPDVTDAEMALAINYAWQKTHAYQKREALFLETVPEMLRAMRERNRVSPSVATPVSQPVARSTFPEEPESSGSPWMQIRLRMRERVSERAYEDWIQRTAFESFDARRSEMRVRVPDQVTKDWLEQEWIDDLVACAESARLPVLHFIFLVGDAK